MKSKPILNVPKDPSIGQGTRLGTRFAQSVLRLVMYSDEGEKIYKQFARVYQRTKIAPTKETLELFDREAKRLEQFASELLKQDQIQLVKDEIDRCSRVIAHYANTSGILMPESARFTAILTEATRVKLKARSARYHGIFLKQMARLNQTVSSAEEQLALDTYWRMTNVIGHESEEGWSRVFDYCALNAENLAEVAKQLRALKALPSVPHQQLHLIYNKGFYSVRGELGETYLHHWPAWQLQRSSLEEIAAGVTHKMGRGWRHQPFSGGILLDGNKTWDEGILLLKPPTAGDRLPHAALHTAVQVKVELVLTALSQTIKDARIREIGIGTKLPVLSVIENGKRRDFYLEPLPLGIEPIRYIFYALGGRLNRSDVERLRAAHIQLTAMPMDISVDGFSALALQAVNAAEEYLSK